MSKIETLFEKLCNGWCDVPSLCAEFGWKPHSLRAAVSGLVLPANGKIERRRENGVTSYRVSTMEIAE
jgi:DNA-binding transcriptional regulator PaaX